MLTGLARRKKPRTPVWGALWMNVELAIQQSEFYLISEIAFTSLATTSFGSGA